MNEGCHLAGMGADYTALTVAELARFESARKSGLRQFYFHPPVDGRIVGRPGTAYVHKWSFLEPVTTLTINPSYDTGTISITQGAATLTLSVAGTFPSWVDSDSEILYDGTYYAILTRDGDNQLTMAANWVPDTLTDETDWTLVRRVYALPDDFGYIIGPFTYPENVRHMPIDIIGESQLRSMQNSAYTSGYPAYAAVRPKSSTGAAGQRFELIVWPASSISAILRYKYAVLPDNLVASTKEYPLGGMAHSETILQSVLSIVEERFLGGRGEHYARFLECLASSIAYDLQQAPEHLLMPADRWNLQVAIHTPRSTRITYNGVAI